MSDLDDLRIRLTKPMAKAIISADVICASEGLDVGSLQDRDQDEVMASWASLVEAARKRLAR